MRNAFSGPQILMVAVVVTGGAIGWLWGAWELWRWFMRALLQ